MHIALAYTVLGISSRPTLAVPMILYWGMGWDDENNHKALVPICIKPNV